jgi:uncharacterized membrane protein YfcA
MLHALGTLALVYLFIGALLWVVLDGLGVISGSYLDRVAEGRRPSALRMAVATVLAIVAWPIVARKLWQHPCWAAKTLARNLWGRP